MKIALTVIGKIPNSLVGFYLVPAIAGRGK
jgi:hypothetical protein